jgi:RHS repeat-associated protein
MAADPKKGSDEKLQQIQIADLQKLAVLSGHKVSFAKNKPKEQESAEDSLEQTDQKQQRLSSTALLYFYHPDHLGTSTFLTDYNGNSYQFFLNLPFGETMAEQKSITEDYTTPYKFNGKELDEETGLYYYGARYYDPKISIWLSVDPLAEKFPSWNPYNYTMQNPVNLIDPNGMEPDDWVKKNGKWTYQEKITSPAEAQAAGYDDFRANGSIISNAKIGSGSTGDIYLGAGGNARYASAEDYAVANGGKDFGNSFWNNTQGGAYLYSGGFDYDSRYAGINGNTQFLTASAYSNTGMSIPLALDVGGSASAVTGSISGRLGTNNYGIFGNANGSAFTVDGNFSSGFLTGHGGKYGPLLGANAGAYVLKGEYSGGFSIGGLSMQGTVGGSLASAHIGAYFDSKNGTFNINISENFGLGVGEKFQMNVSIPVPFVKN